MPLKRQPAAALFAIALLQAPGAFAHEQARGVVKERMDAMDEAKTAVKKIAQIFKGDEAYDADEIRSHTKRISDNAGERLIKLFPEGSNIYPSEARSDIWLTWDVFVGHASALERASENLSNAALKDREIAQQAFNELVDTCRHCHDKFKDN